MSNGSVEVSNKLGEASNERGEASNKLGKVSNKRGKPSIKLGEASHKPPPAPPLTLIKKFISQAKESMTPITILLVK